MGVVAKVDEDRNADHIGHGFQALSLAGVVARSLEASTVELTDELQQRRLALSGPTDDECVAGPLWVQQCLGRAGDHEAFLGDRIPGTVLGDLCQPPSRFGVAA